MASENGSGRGRLLRTVGAVAAVVVVGVVVWRMANTSTGVKREVAGPPTILLTPPPPPPPPPPTPPPKTPPEPTKAPTPVPTPSPQPQAAPKAPAPPQQMTVAGAAQAGTDAFGLQAGSGGGRAVIGGTGPGGTGGGGVGGDFAEANYVRYLNALMQDALRQDDRFNRQVFVAEVAVWIGGGGKVSRVSILKTSGDGKLDRSLVTALEGLPKFEEPPPSTLKFPQRVTVRGRRA